MTDEIKETEEQKEEKSLQDLLGMQFKEDGSWIAGNSPIMRKLNRKERRKRDALERKAK